VSSAGRHSAAEKNRCLPAVVCLLCLAVATAACGKKGAPLAPFSNLPAAIRSLTAKRVGAQIVFQFTVPSANIDGRQPADLDRVDLYVHTTRLLQPAEYLKLGTIVGSVKVRRAPPPRENGRPCPRRGLASSKDRWPRSWTRQVRLRQPLTRPRAPPNPIPKMARCFLEGAGRCYRRGKQPLRRAITWRLASIHAAAKGVRRRLSNFRPRSLRYLPAT